MSSLGLQTDGSYLLERHEAQSSCDALYKAIWGRIQLIKGLPAKAKAERAEPPPTASLAFGRLFGGSGSTKGLKTVQEYDRELAHAHALQRAMREKNCIHVDLDLELREVNAEMDEIRKG
jgi:hypothetical protein